MVSQSKGVVGSSSCHQSRPSLGTDGQAASLIES